MRINQKRALRIRSKATKQDEIDAVDKYISTIKSSIKRNYKVIFDEEYGKDQ